jgi:hypothetical protein
MIRTPHRTIKAQASPIAAENIIVGFAREMVSADGRKGT